METFSKDIMINVEGLKSRLLHGRTTRARFRLAPEYFTEKQVTDMLTAAVKAEVEYRNREYRDTMEIKAVIQQAAKWLMTSPKSGLLLCGKCGNGKTTLMNAIRDIINFLNRDDRDIAVLKIDALELVRLSQENRERYNMYKGCPMLAIDDIGLEPAEVLHYGNVFNPITELLSHRYNEQLFTLVTTNLKPTEIRQKYGDRLADRFNEMMDKIMFKEESFRTL